MTQKTRRQTVVLGGLVMVLAFVMWWGAGSTSPATGTAQPSNPAGRVSTSPRNVSVVDVRLDRLERSAERLSDATRRNPIRFRPKAPPPAPPRPVARSEPAIEIVQPQLPQRPPPRLPIPLRFVGVVEERAGAPRYAVFAASDGRGSVMYGKEGDIIEGRYRVLRIGTDSADLSYTDGRGQQTLRLSGQ